MLPFSYRLIVRYGIAVVVSGAALLLRIAFLAFADPRSLPYLAFYPAVLLAAVLGGLGPGLLATALSALIADYWILQHLPWGNPADLLRLVVFTGTGLFMSVVAEWYRRAHQRATDSAKTLAAQTQQLRTLAVELTRAEQRERQRIGAILHEDLQQLLAGVKLALSPLEETTDLARVRTIGREAGALLQRALDCTRSLTHELVPPVLSSGGLLPALEGLAQWMADTYHLTVTLRAATPIRLDSAEVTVFLFHAIRELLFNAVKHAHVQTAEVEITQHGERVQVRVSDAGAGFDPARIRLAGGSAGGFGLFSLSERLGVLGGTLEIESTPGHGSRFTLSVPLRPFSA